MIATKLQSAQKTFDSDILIPGRISNGSRETTTCAQVCNSELNFLLFYEQNVYFDVKSIRLTFFALHIIQISMNAASEAMIAIKMQFV